MRVISGQARGRGLKSPKGYATRPTSDRVKEAIFNVLASKTTGSHVLDVFAGTGGLGIEALSRGAEYAVFIEKNRGAWSVVRDNLAITGLRNSAQVYLGDYFLLLPRIQGKFDLVFLDPPYNQGFMQKAVSLIISLEMLKDGGVIIIETNSKHKEMPESKELALVKESVYGDTAVLYYQYC